MLCIFGNHRWHYISKTLRLCKRCGKFQVEVLDGKWARAAKRRRSPCYDEDELNEVIVKGTKAWKGVDFSEHIK